MKKPKFFIEEEVFVIEDFAHSTLNGRGKGVIRSISNEPNENGNYMYHIMFYKDKDAHVSSTVDISEHILKAYDRIAQYWWRMYRGMGLLV